MKTGKKSFIGRCCFNSPSCYEIGDYCAASRHHSRGGCTWRRATFAVSQVHRFARSRQLNHLNIVPCCLPIQSRDCYLFINYSAASSLSHSHHLDLLFWPHKPQDAKCNKKGKRLALLRLSRVILLCHRASNLSLSLFISFVTREDESDCRDLDNVTRTERIGWFWHSVTAR